MNIDIIKGKWAELSEDDVGQSEGHRDYLVGRLQERYGRARDRAEAKVVHFESEFSSAD